MKRLFLFFCFLSYTLLIPLFGQSLKPTGSCTVTMSANTTICSGESATLTAIGSGGTGPYTYDWSPTLNVSCPSGPTCGTTTVIPSGTITYTCLVTDVLSCTSTGTVSVNVNPTPSASVSGTTTICKGQTTTLSASGGVSYSWLPGGLTTSAISVGVSTGTTYTVTCTDVNGCTDIATQYVTVNSTPTVSISGNATICNGSSTILSASGGISYSWLPTGNTGTAITVSPSTGANYTVTGTDANSCSSSNTYSVTVNQLPAVSITGTTTICNGQQTTLTAPGGLSYNWLPGHLTTSAISVGPTTGTSYTVIVIDGNSCTNVATQSVTVNPLPDANAGSDVSICAGSNTTLNATGNGNFAWSPSTGLSNTTISNPTADPTTLTNYTVTVTNSCGSSSDEVQITINSTPSVNAGPDATICSGGSTPLVASGSGSYAWSPSAGLSNSTIANPVASPTSTSNYTVTITDVCGTASDVVAVNVNTPSVTVSGPVSICSGSPATLSASGGGTYAWNTGLTTSTIVVSPTSSTGYTVTITDSFGCTDNDTLTLNVNSLPAPTITGNTLICAGVNTALTASGGLSYSWNNGMTASTITVNPTTGTGYTVSVTDINGCTNTSSTFLNVNPQPVVNAGADATICFGSSTSLNAIGNGTYNWSPSAGLSNTTIANPVANPTTSTDYTVTVTNSCGISSDVVNVYLSALPSAVISGNATICLGTADTLVTTGGGTYQWSTGATNDSIFIIPSAATGYSVTVTGTNGCTNSGVLTVNTSSVNASIIGTSVICNGQSSTITASGGTTYLWNTGSTNALIVVSPTTGTNYTVTVSNALGCTDMAIFSVNPTPQPVATISASSTTICNGSSTSLNAGGGTSYLWSPISGLNNTTVANPTANPTALTNYTVVVSIGSCKDTANISITVNPVPTTSLTVSAPVICIGSCATLSASGGGFYSWSPGGQTASSIIECPTSFTNYSVTVSNIYGCTKSAATLINVLSTVSVTVSPNTTICAGNQTTLSAQGGGIYLWSPGGETTSFIVVSPITSTTYSVNASNGACSDTGSISVNVNPLPAVTAVANPYSIALGNSSTLTGTTSTGTYNWSPVTGLTCGACPNPVASPTTTTTYTLTTVDASGCSSMDTVIVRVTLECGDIFIPTAFSPNNDGHNDVFRVRFPLQCIKTMQMTIYNRWGQKVFTTEDPSEVWDGTVNDKLADPAVFFYIINVEMTSDKFNVFQGNVSLVK